MRLYSLTVGNIGTVHEGFDGAEACRQFREYRDQSNSGFGRAAGEQVTLMRAGEPILEHAGYAEMEVA